MTTCRPRPRLRGELPGPQAGPLGIWEGWDSTWTACTGAGEPVAAARATASRELCAALCSAAFCSAHRRGRPTHPRPPRPLTGVQRSCTSLTCRRRRPTVVCWCPGPLVTRAQRAAKGHRTAVLAEQEQRCAPLPARMAPSRSTLRRWVACLCQEAAGGAMRAPCGRACGSARAMQGQRATPCKQRCQMVSNPGALAVRPMPRCPCVTISMSNTITQARARRGAGLPGGAAAALAPAAPGCRYAGA